MPSTRTRLIQILLDLAEDRSIGRYTRFKAAQTAASLMGQPRKQKQQKPKGKKKKDVLGLRSL